MPPQYAPHAIRRVLPWLLALIAGAADAQPSGAAAKPEPAVTLPYTSVLSAYRAYSEQPVQAWRETNDEVARIGGWRAYAREMTAGGMNAGEMNAGQMNAGDLTPPSAPAAGTGTHQHQSGKHQGHEGHKP